VTALCITRNRRQWLPKAIACFLSQTYHYREMLIIADGEDVKDLVPDDDRIRLIQLEGSMRIGEKRNYGCERAHGDVIAHWDDDDYSAPDRLKDQIARLTSSGKACTGYRTMRFTDGTHSWMYEGVPLYAVGTSLCYRRDWWASNPFLSKQVGEDGEFLKAAAAAKQIEVADAGNLMYATIHQGNTSPRDVNAHASYRQL
jgi:glycosyltransferase involved in cell wall biosynthesis